MNRVLRDAASLFKLVFSFKSWQLTGAFACSLVAELCQLCGLEDSTMAESDPLLIVSEDDVVDPAQSAKVTVEYEEALEKVNYSQGTANERHKCAITVSGHRSA
jgi:predicted peptidase